MEQPQPRPMSGEQAVSAARYRQAVRNEYPQLFPPASGCEINCPEAWLPVLDQLFAAIQTYVNTTLHNVRRKDGTMQTVPPPQLVVEVCEAQGGSLCLEFKPAVWPAEVVAECSQVSVAMLTAYHDALVEGMVSFARHLCSMA